MNAGVRRRRRETALRCRAEIEAAGVTFLGFVGSLAWFRAPGGAACLLTIQPRECTRAAVAEKIARSSWFTWDMEPALLRQWDAGPVPQLLLARYLLESAGAE